jgi:hypothetical protein
VDVCRPRTLTAFCLSLDGLHIGPHDVGDTTDLRELPEFIRAAAILPAIGAQGFQGYVEADLVPVLEAVGYRLGGTVDAEGCALYRVFLDGFRECRTGHADDTERRIVYLRTPRAGVYRYPYLERVLRRQVVESESGEQADNAVRYAFRGLKKALVFGWRSVCRDVDATAGADEVSLFVEALQMLPGDSLRLHVFRADRACLTDSLYRFFARDHDAVPKPCILCVLYEVLGA